MDKDQAVAARLLERDRHNYQAAYRRWLDDQGEYPGFEYSTRFSEAEIDALEREVLGLKPAPLPPADHSS